MVEGPYLPLQGVWVQALVEELRSHMQCNQKKKNSEFKDIYFYLTNIPKHLLQSRNKLSLGVPCEKKKQSPP